MLGDEDRHGYAIRQAILDHTDGAIEVEAGNLYRHIRRLERDELIAETDTVPRGVIDDERRRYYTLTKLGKRVLVAELSRMRALLRYAEDRRVIAPVRS